MGKTSKGDGGETVKQAVLRMNNSEMLSENLPVKRMKELVRLIGPKSMLAVLRTLEARAAEIEVPWTWLRAQAHKRCGKLLVHVDSLNRSVPGRMDLLAPIDIDAVREPLTLITEPVAYKIIKELESRISEIVDPTSWIIEK